MQGVVDGAHWVALAVVLASVLRSAAAWRALLGLAAGTGAALACIVIARHYHIHVPIFSGIPELHLPRMSGPLGNPTWLSVCMLFNLLLALGFAVRSWLPAPQPAPAPEPQRRRGRRRGASARHGARAGARWPGRLLWAAAAAVLFWGLALAGSVGGFLGLFAGIGFAALGYAVLGRGRGRWIALAALAALAVSAVAIGMRVLAPDRSVALRFDHPVADYVASVHLQRPGVQSRLAAWEAGLEGLAARPVLGWGPENFEAVFGRFASGYGAFAEPHDQAHGKLVEVAATTGVAGLLAWLALWAAAILVLWRAARGMAGRERAFAVFAGAALIGALVQGQFLFDTAVGMLQTVLLLGFAVSLESGGGAGRPPAATARAVVVATVAGRGERAARQCPDKNRGRRGCRGPGDGRPHGQSGDLRRRGPGPPAAPGLVVAQHGGRHRGLRAARQHLALVAVQRACTALAAHPGRGRRPRPGPARLGGEGGAGGGPHRAGTLAHPAEPRPDVPRGGGDGPRIRGAGGPPSGAGPGARTQPGGVPVRAGAARRARAAASG